MWSYKRGGLDELGHGVGGRTARGGHDGGRAGVAQGRQERTFGIADTLEEKKIAICLPIMPVPRTHEATRDERKRLGPTRRRGPRAPVLSLARRTHTREGDQGPAARNPSQRRG